MALVYSAGLELEATRQGSYEPMAGWVSPRYGEMIPAPQVALRVNSVERVSAVALQGSGRPSISSLACETLAGGASVLQVEGVGFSDLVVVNLETEKRRRLSLDRLTFAGDVLWVRQSTDGTVAIRALATKEVTLPDHGIVLNAAADAEDFDLLTPS
jgi:hypothetical protein